MPDTIDALFAFIFAGAAVWTLVPATESLARGIGDRAIDYPNERSLHEHPTPKLGGLAVLVAVLIGGTIFLPWDHGDPLDPGRGDSDHRGRGDRRSRRPACRDQAARTDRGGDHPGRLGGDRRQLHPAVSRRGRSRLRSALRPARHRRDRPRPGLDRVRHRRGRQRDQPDRRRRRPRSGRLPDLGWGAGRRSHCRSTATLPECSRPSRPAASLGFLRHGFPPASSFMGDTGSNLLGYLMAVVTVQGALKTNAVVALFFPLRGARRADPRHGLRGRQAAQVPPADLPRRTWHFHHRMARIGFSQRRTLAYLYGWTLVLAGAGPGPALRPLQRQPRPLRRRLDHRDGRSSWSGRWRPASTSSTCWRSSSCGASGSGSSLGSEARPPLPTRRRSTQRSRTSSTPAPSRRSIRLRGRWPRSIPTPARSRRSGRTQRQRHLLPSPIEPAHHRPLRHAQGASGLPVAETSYVYGRDDLPVLKR